MQVRAVGGKGKPRSESQDEHVCLAELFCSVNDQSSGADVVEILPTFSQPKSINISEGVLRSEEKLKRTGERRCTHLA